MSENEVERIKEALESIEPTEEAKERMLANIRRKTAEQNKTAAQVSSPKKADMKEDTENVTAKTSTFKTERNEKALKGSLGMAKIGRIVKWALPIAAGLVLIVAGSLVIPRLLNSQGSKIGGNTVQIVNPITEMKDAKAVKDRLGISIDAPEGAENVTYSVIMGQTADIRFDLDGHNYIFRASKETDLIIGLYGTEEKKEKLGSETDAELTVLKSGEDSYKMIKWHDGKTLFVIANTDGASEEELKSVFEKLD